MKKALLGLSFFLMLSCSSDDEKKISSNEIVGKWHLVDILENGKPISGYSCNKELDITEFTSDGSSVTKYSDKNSSNVCVQYSESGTYTVVDNILTDTQKNGNVIIYEAKYKIKELTSTSLKLESISVFETNNDGSNPNTDTYSEGQSVNVYNRIN
jgi:hypothetical protein